MNTLSSLMRNNNILPVCRNRKSRKTGNINYERRKTQKRLKLVNIYTRQYQGQQVQNNWVTLKRLKAIGNHYESMRNFHRGSFPIPEKMQKQLLQVLTKHSDYQYYLHRNRYLQWTQANQAVEELNFNEVLSNLPQKTRKQFEALQNDPQPQELDIVNIYNEQLQTCLPEDQKRRYNLLWILKQKTKNRDQNLKLEDQIDQ